MPTVASLLNAMKESKERIQVKGKSLLKKKVREFLLEGILIEKERSVNSVFTLVFHINSFSPSQGVVDLQVERPRQRSEL